MDSVGKEQPELRRCQPDRVYFQSYVLAPLRVGTLLGLSGTNRIASDGGRYRPLVGRKAPVGGSVTTSILGVITGEAADHDAMLAAIATARSHLTYQFVDPGGEPFELSAEQLMDSDGAEAQTDATWPGV